MTTALERRHPAILKRKREAERRMLEQVRYSDGDCVKCGVPLDDVSLAEGYEKCGECELGGRMS
jgi:hypothetical protein